MKRRLWVSAAVGLAGLGISACDVKTYNSAATGTAVQVNPNPATRADTDIGVPLYEAATIKASSAAPGAAGEAIVVNNCQVTVPYTENVPSKNDGKFFDVVTELRPGELEKLPPSEIFTNPFDSTRKYRRLHEGDTVVPGQLVAILDDRVAKSAHDGAQANLSAANLSVGAAKEVVKAANDQLEIQVRLGKGGIPGASSPLELAEFTKRSAESKKTLADAQGMADKAGPELQKAIITLQDHEIRATIGGVIKAIYKRPGEAVKALEPVIQLQNQTRLRIEGQLNVQSLARLKNVRGAVATIEPSPRQAGVELVGHWQPVTAVDVSKDARKPLIVSASEDKTVRVWERSVQKANWAHPVAVRAVACTGPKSALNLVLSGADDGVARLWDLNDLTAKPREMKQRHDSRINSVAFSPDGEYCASADDRKVKVWATGTGELKYEFGTDHRGPVSSVQFTPQAKLVTAARDRTMRVWNLGEKGAKLDSVIEHRAGNVGTLDVSHDGHHILFDQDKALHVLAMGDHRTEAVLPSPTESSQFHAFAVFSPDSKLILAGGTGDSPLQLWRAPAPGVRPQQIRRLALTATLPTCAAFSPDGAFAVTGAQDYRVYLWEMPSAAEVAAKLEGRITNLDRSIDSTDQKVRVWAEVDNTTGQLLPGDTVSMVLTPSDAR